jgi:UDP:flavonoid glycosyltransferase YjiC (YdhE family)
LKKGSGEVVVLSTQILRERLWRLEEKQFVIDEYFDKLPTDVEERIETRVKKRLGGLLTRISENLSEDEYQQVFEKKKLPSINITIQTVGSRGDVQPFLFAARELQKKGHKVVLATHDKFRKFVEDFGVRFFPLALGRDDHWQPEQLMRYAESNPTMGPDLLMRPKALYHIVSHAPEMAQTLRTILLPPGGQELSSSYGPIGSVAEADALIANPPSYAHVHLAEAFGIPLHLVFTMPWTPTRTVGHPLCVSSADTNAYWKELSYRWMSLLQWRGSSGAVNDFRASMGLNRHYSSDAFIVDKWRVPFAYMFSQVLMPKPSDWGAHIDVTGFITDDSTAHLSFTPPANLETFLNHEPVYIGFGSISSDLSHMYKAILAACTLFPRTKFLIHKGWSPLHDLVPEDFPANTFLLCPPPSLAATAAKSEDIAGEVLSTALSWEERMMEALGKDRVCFLASVPHPWLFPRCSAVVHHGGAGTTAAGLSTGRPTVVCAFFGDQVIWGQMVERLKCGSIIMAREEDELDARIDQFRAAFEFALTAEARKNAREVADALELEKSQGAGAKAVVEAFERQMPWELIACEICEHTKADRICGTFGIQTCTVCAAAIEDFIEFPLRRVDWGHSRVRGVVKGGVDRLAKAIVKLRRRPVQGFEAVGIVGLVSGLILAIFELILEAIRLPYHVLMDIWSESRTAPSVGESLLKAQADERNQLPQEDVNRIRAKVLELKMLRVKIALGKEELPEMLLSENLRTIVGVV